MPKVMYDGIYGQERPTIPDERDQKRPRWPESPVEQALRRLEELERRVEQLEGRDA